MQSVQQRHHPIRTVPEVHGVQCSRLKYFRIWDMDEGFQSLVRSLRAFVGFWFAFLCATLCNTLIPIDTLRDTFPLRHVITDAMVELRLKFLDIVLRDGKLNILYAVWTLLVSASTNFIGWFKEIFVIVTLFHFTPLLQSTLHVLPRKCRHLSYIIALSHALQVLRYTSRSLGGSGS